MSEIFSLFIGDFGQGKDAGDAIPLPFLSMIGVQELIEMEYIRL